MANIASRPSPEAEPQRFLGIRLRLLLPGLLILGLLTLLTWHQIGPDGKALLAVTQAKRAVEQRGGTSPRTSGLHRVQPRFSGFPVNEAVNSLSQSDTNASLLAAELIVQLKPGATNIDEIAATMNAKVTGRIPSLNAYRLEFENAAAADAARAKLAGADEVASLDSNYSLTRPADSTLASSTATTANGLTITPGDSNGKLVVGLIDTAVQVASTGLDSSFFLPSLSVAGESTADANTPLHGTSMAEAILQGVAAVNDSGASSVRILSVDVYGNSETTSTFQVAEGIVSAIANGATIINLSLGGDSGNSLLQQVITDAYGQGIIFLSSAGNESVTTATYPAAYSQVIAVTATDASGNIASYANYGDFVDVAAPGTIVVNYNGQSYIVVGTSSATALVSGVAAGIAEKSSVTAAQVEQTIRTGLAAP
ncbi:MAG: S8 family serine peptidase [Verrucomicrobiota bacterium]